MKFLHTADWHLGKRLHDFPLLEVQGEALARIVDHVADQRPDALLLAGDVFDTQVPQVGALELWERTVDAIVGDLGVPMVVIPGNHDHADRMSVHAGLARRAGLHFLRSLSASAEPVVIGGVRLFGVPFHKPVHVRAAFPDAPAGIGDFDYAGAMRAVLERVQAARQAFPGPSVLLAHAFVDGAGEEPEGEDAIQVGGAGGVPLSAFAGFDYVALGHIHGPRQLGGAPVHYAGSPYPYAFAEAGQEKSLNLVELDQDGRLLRLERLPIPSSRGVRVIGGLSFEQVLRAAAGLPEEQRRHHTLVRVTDTVPIDGALPRLREWYPYAVLEQPAVVARSSAPKLEGDHRSIRPEEAFWQFYRHVFADEPSALERSLLLEALHGEAAETDGTAR